VAPLSGRQLGVPRATAERAMGASPFRWESVGAAPAQDDPEGLHQDEDHAERW
jgi:hypothetical protein